MLGASYIILQPVGKLRTAWSQINSPSEAVVDITLINYRGHAFILDVLEGEEYVMRKKENGEIVRANSPMAQGVVKAYRESQNDFKV